jgi:hypothetical protein
MEAVFSIKCEELSCRTAIRDVMSQTNYFLQTLQHLRHYEEVLLFTNLLRFTEDEQKEAVHYLMKEYGEESLNYPFRAPDFNADAAGWAARTLYLASQLLLYREHKEADLPLLFPAYEGEINAAAVLSADLVLRFLPDVILQLKAIDPEDGLIAVLENHLKTWHYSGISYPLPAAELDFEVLASSPSLFQLYIDRVILYKNISLAKHPALKGKVNASLGLYAAVFWDEFKQATITENETY